MVILAVLDTSSALSSEEAIGVTYSRGRGVAKAIISEDVDQGYFHL